MTNDMKYILALVGMLILFFFFVCLTADYFHSINTNKITCPHCHEEFIITP